MSSSGSEHEEHDHQQLIDSQRSSQHKTTNLETLMHMFKGNLGTGLLSLPLAIYHGGWVVGPIFLTIISIMAIHCMHLLVKSSHHMCRRRGFTTMDYGEVATNVLDEYGPGFLRNRSHIGSKCINVFILITQFGFCCCYFVFISANIQQVTFEYAPKDSTLHELLKNTENANRVIMALLVIPIGALCSIRNLDHLAPFSAMANVFTAVSVAIIFSYLIPNLQNPITADLPKSQSFDKFALFFGTAIFSFEGISVILPLENKCEKPKDFPKILNGSMFCVTILYLCMGILGYLTFGEDVCGSITLNLPQEPLYASVKILYSFVIFISFALQFYVPITFLWPPIEEKFLFEKSDKTKFIWELLFRYFLIICVCALAVAIPDLGDIISLIGAMASSMLALIMPPLIDQLIISGCAHRGKWFWPASVKNCAIVLFGFIGMIVGTYVSIDQLVTDLSGSSISSGCAAANSTGLYSIWYPPKRV